MEAICICGHKIEFSYHDCEFRCSSNQVWWCDECGAIAIGYNDEIPQPDEFIKPKGYL